MYIYIYVTITKGVMDFGVGVTWKKEMENYVNLEFIYEKEKK